MDALSIIACLFGMVVLAKSDKKNIYSFLGF